MNRNNKITDLSSPTKIILAPLANLATHRSHSTLSVGDYKKTFVTALNGPAAKSEYKMCGDE